MPRPLAILLPPSQGKRPGGDGPGWHPAGGRFGERLAGERLAVAEALAAAGGGDAKLLGAKGDTLARAQDANRSVVGAPTLPALDRYTGVVWDHLDVRSLRPAARRKAYDSVIVLSALAGAVALDDPLPDHRLTFHAAPTGLGRLSSYWRPALSAALDDHLDGRLVIDLLPGEHAAAWRPDLARYDLRRVVLRAADGRVGGHDAKAAKGRLARALLEGRSPAKVLATWADGPYTAGVHAVEPDG